MALDLTEIAARVALPDEGARRRAADLVEEHSPQEGSLGRLGELGIWLAATQGRCPTALLERVRLVVFAGDHDTTETDAPDTAATVRALLAGAGRTNVLAELAGSSTRVVDVAVDGTGLPAAVTRHKVRRGSGRIDIEDALTRAEASAAFTAGVSVADDEVDSGADLLVAAGLGAGGALSAWTLATLLTNKDVASVIGIRSVADDRAWMHSCAAVRDAARRGRRVLGDRGDMIDLLAAVGGAEIAALTGFVVQSAVRRTPVVLDGLVTCAAAVVARRVSTRVTRWLVAGHRSPDPGHAALVERLRLTPVVDFEIGVDDGVGALLAVPPLRSAAALLASLGSPGPEPKTG